MAFCNENKQIWKPGPASAIGKAFALCCVLLKKDFLRPWQLKRATPFQNYYASASNERQLDYWQILYSLELDETETEPQKLVL